MKLLLKKLNRKGQNITEYSLVIILVAAGIITMQNYVKRGFQANIKTLEDSMVISMQDPLLEVQPGLIPQDGCDCEPFNTTACGGGGGPVACEWWQRYATTVCTPLGCNLEQDPPFPDASCQDSPDCCQETETGRCGSYALYASCEPSEMEIEKICGDPNAPVEYECQPREECARQCAGNAPRNSTICDGDDQNIPDPPPAWTTVQEGNCSVPAEAIKCETECAFPEFPTFGNTTCGRCTGATVIQGDCGVNQCDREDEFGESCPENHCWQ